MLRASWRCLVALLFSLSGVQAGTQEETETKFYPVQLGPVQSFTALKFKGDYAELDFPSGHVVTGNTPAGVTVVMLFGPGKLSLGVPPKFEAKVREAFGMYPVNAALKSAYLRLAPKEYAALVQGVTLQQANNAEIAKLAKEMYDLKFYGSFHAGALAILPPEDTRYIDAETKELGQVILEEGYFLKLTRIVPYVAIFPPGFENPKFMEKGK
ncbi:MAG: hypothetical protein HY652_10265 [Acidobacteria bacterium]|nr:hypothetical protein [Acidobacteriota bacterium]